MNKVELACLDELISMSLVEDLGVEETGEGRGRRYDLLGDVSSVACIPAEARGEAKMVAKEEGVVCGSEVAKRVFEKVGEGQPVEVEIVCPDGSVVQKGEVLMKIRASVRTILVGERTALNFMQRMSGIATKTRQMVSMLEGLHTQLLDTRKTTPGMRQLEKYAVHCGGGTNHRMGLYDMVMLKDNHIDFAGGIEQAIDRTRQYLQHTGKERKIEIEVRNLEELDRVMKHGGVDRIMLDNFDVPTLKVAVERIAGRYESEASGGITEQTLRRYAETGVDFISVGALTHHIKSMDISLLKN